MNRLSKSLLTASLVATVVGVFVSFTSMPLSPVWTIVLPYGAIFFALFLISFLFQKAFTDSGEGEQTEMQPTQPRKVPSSRKDARGEPAMAPPRHAFS